MTVEFKPWPKVPRLNRRVIITEKIDGTNAAIGITDEGEVYAQSRNRIITPTADNAGFAKWVADNSELLRDMLGPGLHFGEWWGKGIQRNYGLDGKVFSLFNVERHVQDYGPDLRVVPVLYEGPFSEIAIARALNQLGAHGSAAAPGFMNPEGIVVFHTAAGQMFKVTLENDEQPKSRVAA